MRGRRAHAGYLRARKLTHAEGTSHAQGKPGEQDARAPGLGLARSQRQTEGAAPHGFAHARGLAHARILARGELAPAKGTCECGGDLCTRGYLRAGKLAPAEGTCARARKVRRARCSRSGPGAGESATTGRRRCASRICACGRSLRMRGGLAHAGILARGEAGACGRDMRTRKESQASKMLALRAWGWRKRNDRQKALRFPAVLRFRGRIMHERRVSRASNELVLQRSSSPFSQKTADQLHRSFTSTISNQSSAICGFRPPDLRQRGQPPTANHRKQPQTTANGAQRPSATANGAQRPYRYCSGALIGKRLSGSTCVGRILSGPMLRASSAR